MKSGVMESLGHPPQPQTKFVTQFMGIEETKVTSIVPGIATKVL